ncbi:site-specific integrase [Vibrio parahaemolyticus]|uniref:hypothetical protein n=1 Tax=Vibrio parahaemolyticus TaxID=670 RepID=UPI001D16BD7D|nr:hypothetical protein [Vibrio parahaemolyticus]MCC3859113.1 site-specific integrase [Vibrio parahaemolyticus]
MDTTERGHLTDTIDALHFVNDEGRIQMVDLHDDNLSSINSMPIWDSASYTVSDYGEQTFGQNRWVAEDKVEDSAIFNTNSQVMDAEVKACCLLETQVGYRLGEDGISWSKSLTNIRMLNHFGRYLTSRGLESFRALDTWSEVWLTHIIQHYLQDDVGSGGLNFPEAYSARMRFERAIMTACNYGLIKKPHVINIMSSAFDSIDNGISPIRLSHSIIPNDAVKALINIASTGIKNVDAIIDEWEDCNTLLIDALNKKVNSTKTDKSMGEILNNIGFSNHNKRLKKKTRLNVLKERMKELNSYFEDLRSYVLVLVLLFSGMRISEATSIQVGAAHKIKKNGVYRYTVTATLSKTDDTKVELDWVINEEAFNAITLLSRFTSGVHERAKAFLEIHGNALSVKIRHRLEQGLAENLLFGVSPSIGTANFTKAKINSDNKFGLSGFNIPLTIKDVFQLESLDCNYQAILGKRRGKPYKAGDIFNLTAHQFRHTFAYFIIANRLGDLDDIKYQFKHLSSAMTLVYSNRGYESIEELYNIAASFEKITAQNLAKEMISLAKQKKLGGGGGRRLINGVETLTIEIELIASNDDIKPVEKRQIHFPDMDSFERYMVKHFLSTRGLPHGICTKGSECKIKNSPDPSGCVFCPTYLASERHLPAWEVLERQFTQKLSAYESMPEHLQKQYEAMASGWQDELDAAKLIISQIKGIPDTEDMA